MVRAGENEGGTFSIDALGPMAALIFLCLSRARGARAKICGFRKIDALSSTKTPLLSVMRILRLAYSKRRKSRQKAMKTPFAFRLNPASSQAKRTIHPPAGRCQYLVGIFLFSAL